MYSVSARTFRRLLRLLKLKFLSFYVLTSLRAFSSLTLVLYPSDLAGAVALCLRVHA